MWAHLYLPQDNPASLVVGRLAAQVANASGVACSSADIAALLSLDKAVSDAEDNIAAELTEAQSYLEGTYGHHRG